MNHSLFIPIFFFGAVLIFSYLILPEQFLLQDSKSKLKAEELEIIQAKQHVASLQNIAKGIKNNAKYLTIIKESIPNKPSLPSFLNMLQQNAVQSGLVLKDVSANFPQRSAGFSDKKIQTIQVAIKLIGDYQSFKNFLNLLEKSTKIVNVKHIEISPQKGSFLNLQLLVETYYRKG